MSRLHRPTRLRSEVPMRLQCATSKILFYLDPTKISRVGIQRKELIVTCDGQTDRYLRGKFDADELEKALAEVAA